MVIFTCCGTLFSFGVVQELYERMSREPGNPFSGASPAAIDLIGTLGVSFQSILAPFATAWSKRFSPRTVLTCGGLTFAVACILASFSQRLWQFQLTQGLLLGIGTCFSYMPVVTVAPTWYNARRGLAMGIILAGTGIGGVVWAPAIRAMNDHLGFRNTLRISGALSGGLVLAAAAVIDWDPETKARLAREHAAHTPAIWRVPLLDWRIARSRTFLAQLAGAVLQGAAYYTPVFFFSAYARTLGFSATAGANFIAVSNVCNALGKIAIGLVADRFGRIQTLYATTLISALATFGLWMPSTLSHDSHAGRGLFIAYTVMYGNFASAYVSLFPTSLVELFGPAHFAGANGVLYMARGLASLAGTPAAGALIRSAMGGLAPMSYWRMSLLVAVLYLGASFAIMWVLFERKSASRA